MRPDESDPRRGGNHGEEELARALGWLCIGPGLTEVTTASSLSRTLGREDRAGLVRAFGLREIATGLGILSRRRPAPWIWARVGGDILDLVALAPAHRADTPKRSRVGVVIGAIAAVTATDVMCGQRLSRR